MFFNSEICKNRNFQWQGNTTDLEWGNVIESEIGKLGFYQSWKQMIYIFLKDRHVNLNFQLFYKSEGRKNGSFQGLLLNSETQEQEFSQT